MFRRRPRLATQTLLAQIAVLVLVLGTGFALTVQLARHASERQYEQRALAVARATAEDPVIIARLAAGQDTGGDVQQHADAIRKRTGMLFVVVADTHGIRYAHPDPEQIGKEVSTPPTALSGRESVAVARGFLGVTARAKVPLLTADGRIVGEVNAGVKVGTALEAAVPLIREQAWYAGAALLLGTAGAMLLTRRLKRQTLGLEPVELADLLREQQAVLGGVGDGVLAVDAADRITVCNAEAARLLNMDDAFASGMPLCEAGLPEPLTRALAERLEQRQALIVVGERLLVVTGQPVRRGVHDLGHVLTLRDRTEVDELERERAALRALSDALRAQAHEYTNRLHTLSGMLATGSAEQAATYLRELAAAPLATEGRDGARLADPYLRGLLAAKTATASEQGVLLRLDQDSHLPGNLTDPLDVVSVVGNLLDNAVRAAAQGARQPAWVELSVLAEGDTLHLAVIDSGDGIPESNVESLFRDGFTTRGPEEAPGHGIGLPLARQLAVKHTGELRLLHPRGEQHGAVFAARIPRVVEAPVMAQSRGVAP